MPLKGYFVVDTSSSRAANESPLLAITTYVLSTLSFSFMTLLTKIITNLPDGPEAPPLSEITFFRSFFALFPALSWLALNRSLHLTFKTKRFFTHLSRGLIGTLGMLSGFGALLYLPLADATAISYATPLITVIFSALILKETVRIYRWSAVCVGFLGVGIMFFPHMSGETTNFFGAFLGLMGAFFAALAGIHIRILTKTEHTATIVIYFSFTAALISAAIGVCDYFLTGRAWQFNDGETIFLLILIGLLGGLGQILVTQSYRLADVSLLAPFHYTGMIWALALGWLFFDDVPELSVIFGSSIVIAAGLFVVLREHYLGLEPPDRVRTVPNNVSS